MKKSIISLLLAASLLFSTGCALYQPSDDSSTGSGKEQTESFDSGSLQILKTDMRLTQEQELSRIKAEYLVENNGYRDDDEIIVIATLPGDALIDSYLAGKTDEVSVADYAASDAGRAQIDAIDAAQDALIAELSKKGLTSGVVERYNTVLNAVAVRTTWKNLEKISKLASVKKTVLSDTFNLPQAAASAGYDAVENAVDVYETGIFNSGSVSYTGKGTAVAILDSGFDCSHSVFARQPDVASQSDLALNLHRVSELLSETNAAKMDKGLAIEDVYYSLKIPFMFDYADKDHDVFPYDSEHGTHVAGIIGGKDDVITGVAVDTQLVLMKVFPDLDDGAKTEDILAALEDAVLLGVDAINMSLGSSCGFAREEDGNAINAVYDKINESGVSLLTAASNSYGSGYGGAQGNTSMVTNPDSATVGSPSTYAAALSVASISGTKSRYLVGNDSQILFFNESNSVAGKPNDFFKELGLEPGETRTYEYVTVPGYGMKANYAALDVKGKIALVKRGDTTFEDKALQAKNAGAVACIIYNNIDGDILMSMGKTDHIPTISISKDNGTILAARESGTVTVSYVQQAGPFMSDFSSWGPSPNLELKPEITAHGGNIKSSVPGGGYDELSGTSMATPNLCGIVVLIRQLLKERYPEYTAKQISVLTNQMLMSTATIALNEEGNPYSPRKQGAGLASMKNVVYTDAYLTVDGIDRSKLDLGDDPARTGVYPMAFNVVNVTQAPVTYHFSLVGMTESVSTSDPKHIAEKATMLDSHDVSVTVTGDGSYNAATGELTVNAGATLKVSVVYTLTESDKNLIDSRFPYGMYVEGFAELLATRDEGVDLNIPFLAFYGDWTEAPMFDKTYYEVESEAHNKAIDDEDKLKADYYATTPYGSYYYNYIIPLGTYLYDVDEEKYDVIPATEDHIAISDTLGTIDGISAVYAGLLRNATTMTYTITDKVSGEVVYEYVDYNANKAFSYGGAPVPSYEYLRLKSAALELINNRQYAFKMQGMLDYGDGGVKNNVRNSFEFDFYLDNEAPVLKDVFYEKVYDKTQKKDRYYLTMTIYDNQYTQSITPILFTSSSSYTFLTENPIPVYSERGQDTTVRIEITDYLEDVTSDAIITSALAFSIDDYALNSNIYLCQLPGTRGEFRFTKDGTPEGIDLTILSMYEDEVVDLTQYLATADETVDDNKDYLKYLNWSSSNEDVVVVKDGQAHGIKAGRATVIVTEAMDLKQAVLIINVRARKTDSTLENTDTTLPVGNAQNKIRLMSTNNADAASGESVKKLRFSYFETLFAYSRAAQTSEIGETGDRKFLSSFPSGSVSLYPGEKIRLFYDLDPWYTEDRYDVTFRSTNPAVAVVEQDGTVTALKKGTTSIVLELSGSNIVAKLKLNVNSEFVIEDRTLIAYKGLGGDVVIPDDEGILYIGAYAFCLYDTDNSIELTDEDYDANKIPAANTTVKSVVVPAGVEEIQKYAFYNCGGLEKVVLPDSIRFIREYAFYRDEDLKEINLYDVEVIGREAFNGCKSLETVDLSQTYAIGAHGFAGCSSLKTVDLTALRNSGKEIFKDCSALESVTLTADTKLSYGMFVRAGLREVTLCEKIAIPDYCFSQCPNLTKVTLANNLLTVGKGAFCQCPELKDFVCEGTVSAFGEQAFYESGLERFVLPDCPVTLGTYCFYLCEDLSELVFGKNTELVSVEGPLFRDTALETFTLSAENTLYKLSGDGKLLLNAAGDTIVLAAVAADYGEYTIDASITTVGDAAFAGTNVTKLTIPDTVTTVGAYAFAHCASLASVVLPEIGGITIGAHAFHYAEALETVENLENATSLGDYAFAKTAVKNVSIGENATLGEGAFFQSSVIEVTLGANVILGLGAFQGCASLTRVLMPEAGGVHLGEVCFAESRKLSTIDLSKTDGVIPRQAFYGCRALYEARLTNVTEIGDYAFADCHSLSILVMPVVVSIGEGAFARYDKNGGAPMITGLVLPETLTFIGDGAFAGCENLEKVEMNAKLNEVRDYLFAYCISLTDVTLPDTVRRIGVYAFAGCTMLPAIDLTGVTLVDEYAFTSDGELKTVTGTDAIEKVAFGAFASTAVEGELSFPALTTVGDYAFQSTSFTSFDAPLLKNIGDAAFQANQKLSAFRFSSELEKIGMLVFNDCPALRTFSFTDADGKTLTTGKINGYAQLDNGVLYTKTKAGTLQLTSVPEGLTDTLLTVLPGTVRIDFFAGNQNKNLTKVVLPESLLLIGNYAFYGCDNLKTVDFRSFVAPALEDSYLSAAVLTEEDPGYALLHNQFDLFGLELCYYTFIDLAGKHAPIAMILPQNADVEGYDSVVYEAFFGKVKDAERNGYTAMDRNFKAFVADAALVAALTEVTLADEALVNRAVAELNALRQNPAQFGYTNEAWAELTGTVNTARAALIALKLANAGAELRDLADELLALPDEYDGSAELETRYLSVKARVEVLNNADRLLLDLSHYKALGDSYDRYEKEPDPTPEHHGLNDETFIVICVELLLVAWEVILFRSGRKKRKKSGKKKPDKSKTKQETKEERGDIQ